MFCFGFFCSFFILFIHSHHCHHKHLILFVQWKVKSFCSDNVHNRGNPCYGPYCRSQKSYVFTHPRTQTHKHHTTQHITSHTSFITHHSSHITHHTSHIKHQTIKHQTHH